MVHIYSYGFVAVIITTLIVECSEINNTHEKTQHYKPIPLYTYTLLEAYEWFTFIHMGFFAVQRNPLLLLELRKKALMVLSSY